MLKKLIQKLKDAYIPFEYEYGMVAYPLSTNFMYLVGQKPPSNDLVLFFYKDMDRFVIQGDVDKIYNIIKEHWTNELECQ